MINVVGHVAMERQDLFMNNNWNATKIYRYCKLLRFSSLEIGILSMKNGISSKRNGDVAIRHEFYP